jgi:hypothetical protein
MNGKRILAIGKLVLLFGTPLAVIFGLFSCGVYCGVQNRASITRFERDYLGLDVEVPGEPSTPPKDAAAAPPDATAPADAKAPSETRASTDASTPTDAKAPSDAKAPAEPEPTPPVVVPPSTVGGVPAPLAPPTARVDPLVEPLATRLRASRVVRVKVLVDAAAVEAHPAWIDYVQRTVSRASQIYEEQFGISLELVGVGRWAVAREGMGTAALLDELREHPREGADLLLGLTSRPFDGAPIQAEAPAPDEPWNGTHAVVYATAGHREAHLRTLLHEVAHLFGAVDVTDSTDPAHVAGSWMSYAIVPETQAPWIDAANRQRVLERKDLPFAPDGAAAPMPAEDESLP